MLLPLFFSTVDAASLSPSLSMPKIKHIFLIQVLDETKKRLNAELDKAPSSCLELEEKLGLKADDSNGSSGEGLKGSSGGDDDDDDHHDDLEILGRRPSPTTSMSSSSAASSSSPSSSSSTVVVSIDPLDPWKRPVLDRNGWHPSR